MGTAKRAYDLLRGYVNREYDRIRGIDLAYAQNELDESLRSPEAPPLKAHANPPAMMGEPPLSREDRARRILGVGPCSTFDDIRRAYERLNKRGDPSRFPTGSAEREYATEIRKNVQWAYGVLTAHIDPTEKRFKSLEID